MSKKYCPSCGQDVPLEHSLEGNYLLTCCENCGLGLGVQLASADMLRRYKQSQSQSVAKVGLAKRADPIAPVVERTPPPDPRTGDLSPKPASAWASQPSPALQAESSEARRTRQMRRVIIVEDSDFLRQVTRDLLQERQLAREIIDCPDGQNFLEVFTRMTYAGNKPDLVVLDVRMPGLDGREVAFAVRAIESAFGVKRTPILFFSAMLCDAEFKQTLKSVSNARYIRKVDDDVQRLGERITSVLERLVGGKMRPSNTGG